MRLALGVSNAGILGFMDRKMIKVATPNKIRIRLNIKQRIAQHHINRLVRRGRGCRRIDFLTSLEFSVSGSVFCEAGVCWFVTGFDITILSRGTGMVCFSGGGGGGNTGGGGGESMF